MTDLFNPDITDTVRAMVFAAARVTPHHTYVVLTKRPWEARRFFRALSDVDPPLAEWCAKSLWLGVSVEDQERADERVPLLLSIPAARRCVSCEPLLGRVDLERWLDSPAPEVFDDDYLAAGFMAEALRAGRGDCRRALDWVIAGAETGPKARPCDLEWLLLLLSQTTDADVPFFLKKVNARGDRELDGRRWEEFPE